MRLAESRLAVDVDYLSTTEVRGRAALLGAGIPIVEHMTGLAQLPDADFVFHTAPPRVKGMGTFPIRAHAIRNE